MKRLILIGAVGLAIVAGATFWQTRGASTSGGELPMGAVNAQEAAEIDTSSITEMTMGNPDAEVTVIEYASFTCPHCARFHSDQFEQLKADFIETDKINFVYRDVFFDRYGLWASLVARCGGEDRFFGIADMIYDQQRDWIGDGQDPVAIADRLRKIGKVAGLDQEQLDACLMDDEKAKTLVAWFQQNAEADGIRSTPTLVINGTSYNNMAYDELKTIIQDELSE